MSFHEKSAWGSLFASLLAWADLTMRMTAGWAIVDVGARHMIWTYVAVLIIQALAEAAFAGHALPRIDLGALPVLFYALLTVLFAGHVTSQAVTIWLYRA
jgi:hypothetical protein